MKFIYYLEKINKAELFPLISFILFGTFFLVVLFWVFFADKKYIDKASKIPLEDGEEEAKENEANNDNSDGNDENKKS